jgi:hypothetical protein
MAQILTVEDLYTYSIALRNSGIPTQNLRMLETQSLLFLFGKDGARRLVREINTGGADGPNVAELIKGDTELFNGLRALLATIVCTNLLSQNRMQVARQNVAIQPDGSRQTQRREEADVVQALAYSARSLIFAMHDYLQQDGKNPLDLQIKHVVMATRYSTNTSGAIPAAAPFMGFLGWW